MPPHLLMLYIIKIGTNKREFLCLALSETTHHTSTRKQLVAAELLIVHYLLVNDSQWETVGCAWEEVSMFQVWGSIVSCILWESVLFLLHGGTGKNCSNGQDDLWEFVVA